MAEQNHRSLAPSGEARFVSDIIGARKRRSALFGSSLFADPAWDIMLELCLAELEGRRLATSDVGMKTNVPMTTALRWIGSLEAHGWITRIPDPHDQRRIFVELSPQGLETMQVWLRESLRHLSQPAGDGRVSDLLGRMGRDSL